MVQCLSIVYPLSFEEQDNHELEKFSGFYRPILSCLFDLVRFFIWKRKTEVSITAKNILLSNDGENTISWGPVRK